MRRQSGSIEVSSVLLALSALIFAPGCARERFTATLRSGDEVELVRAIKGHELVVRRGGELAKVRLVGIYTFDPKPLDNGDIRDVAVRAADSVERHRQRNLRVTLEREAPDPRGRFLAFLEVDGADVGRLLLAEGLAAVYTEFPFSREDEYLATEARARGGAQGLWGGAVAQQRLMALRETWAAVRTRERHAPLRDPLLVAGGTP